MLDAQKLQKMRDHGDLTEEEFVVQKKRLAARVMRRGEKKQTRNGIVYIVLAFFFGALGLHNFYAGYWGRGLSQLCLTLIAPWFLYVPLLFVAVWALLELLFVGKTAKGVPFSGNRSAIVILRGLSVLALAMAFSYSSLVVEEPDFEEVVVQM